MKLLLIGLLLTVAAPVNDHQAFLPNSTLTPGATLAVTAADICVPGYSKLIRNVPAAVKAQVYREYGIKTRRAGQYEVDHLISLELGGSNALTNLWPQSYLTQPFNARVKDSLENELHREVCSGQMNLTDAQQEIRTDWVNSWRKHFHRQQP